MATALLGIHAGVGAMVGLDVGAGMAVLAVAGRLLAPRTSRAA